MRFPQIRRCRLPFRATALVAVAAVLSACAQAMPLDSATAPAPIFVAGDAGTTRQDAVNAAQARIEGDVLHVQVQFGGGCRDHRFALYREDAFLESLPVQLRLHLSHDAQGDNCRALLSRELAFDLTPVKEAYQRQYGNEGTVILRLHVPGSAEPVAGELRYRF